MDLERLGDLPEADAAPPPNSLFICKLNAVTTEEDLDTIFSRFGTITSCDIIKDYKTGARAGAGCSTRVAQDCKPSHVVSD